MNELFHNLHGTEAPSWAYPNKPGFKTTGTSQEAAVNVSEVQQSHKLILKVLETGNYTSDEIAGKLGLSILYIRPRCTELKRLGKLSKTGLRRANSSGQSANVLCLRQPRDV